MYLYSLGKSPFASGGTPPVASAGWWGGARVYCATESHTPDPSSSTRQCIYFVSTIREKKRRALTTCSLLSRQPDHTYNSSIAGPEYSGRHCDRKGTRICKKVENLVDGRLCGRFSLISSATPSSSHGYRRGSHRRCWRILSLPSSSSRL